MKTNGTTLWIRNPDDNSVLRALCLTNIDLGESTRKKDEEVCLEEPDGVNALPGFEIDTADSTMEGKYDDTADKEALCKWLTDGTDLIPANVEYYRRFETQIVVALPSGNAYPIDVWVHKTKLIALQRKQRAKIRITFATNSVWSGAKSNFNDAATFLPQYADFAAPIKAYYDALAEGATIIQATAKSASPRFRATPVTLPDPN